MTLDEAKKIASIIKNADSGCPVCVDSLVGQCNDLFPKFIWNRNDDTGDVTVKEK